MAAVAYRQAGIISQMGKALLDVWFGAGDNPSKHLWEHSFPMFESSSVVSGFETALKAFPFPVPEECVEELREVYDHVRSVALGEVSENVKAKTGKHDDKAAITASQLLIQIMLDNNIPQESIERLVINLAK